MHLQVPHSTPRSAILSLPLNSFRALYHPATDRAPAMLQLFSVYTDAPLVQLLGSQAADTWRDLRELLDVEDDLILEEAQSDAQDRDELGAAS